MSFFAFTTPPVFPTLRQRFGRLVCALRKEHRWAWATADRPIPVCKRCAASVIVVG